jgi:hypothetical protein
VEAACKKYHANGFEIVSISLDLPRQGPTLLQFIHDNNMTWPQIYDGGYWKAAIAVQYGVHAISCPGLWMAIPESSWPPVPTPSATG